MNAILFPRSSRPDVRNPMLALPAVKKIAAMPLPLRLALADVLTQISNDARERAQKAWKSHKAPQGLYWKIVAVYSRHLKLALMKPLVDEAAAAA